MANQLTPIFNYTPLQRWACPECYRPVSAPRRGKDGRCTDCRRALYRAPKPYEE